MAETSLHPGVEQRELAGVCVAGVVLGAATQKKRKLKYLREKITVIFTKNSSQQGKKGKR